MSIDKKKLAAELLCMQARERVEGERSLRKSDSFQLRANLESDCLYYWILSRLQEKLRGCISGKKSDTIIITGKMTEYNKILLRHGRLADYLPFYVEGKEFFDVIRKTLQIFDDMKNYTYDYYQISGDSCEFWVSISS